MAGGFNNSVVGGDGTLVRDSIHSPNYVPGVAGWSINKDGTAQLNELTIIVQSSGQAILIYDGAAGLGNLIGSWSATDGVDDFGNAYEAGLDVVNSANINNANINSAAITNAILSAAQMNQGQVFESVITFDSSGGMLLMYVTTSILVTLAAGTTTWAAPAGSYTAGYVKTWGSGASGNGGSHGNYSGAGNGGGGYSENSAYPLTPGTTYHLAIPAGGTTAATDGNGHSGGTCTFDTTFLTGPSVSASGGTVTIGNPGGGRGGKPLIGTAGFNGGNGGAASNFNTSLSGGGGAAGGPNGPGGNGGQDGPAGISHGGGNGGAGVTQNNNGHTGVTPGGAGAGAGWTSVAGGQVSGAGGDARITIVYNTTVSLLVGAASPIAGADTAGNAFAAGFSGQITAFQPGSAPTAVETWHNFTMPSGFSGTFRYKYTGLNAVLIDCDISGSTAATSISVTLPVGYVPSIEHRFAVGNSDPGGFTASYAIANAGTGVVQIVGMPASTSVRICFAQLIPLD